MNLNPFFPRLICALVVSATAAAMAQQATLPASDAEREAFYAEVLDRRVDGIMKPLALTDTNKAERVREVLLLQYRTLRLRDEVIDAQLVSEGKEPTDLAARAGLRKQLSQPLSEWFVAVLAVDLAPAQVETIKDEMTYHKVKVTYDAYCEIIPNLTEAEKAKTFELLKAARDEAIGGGSAPEKSAIFQEYKDQINAYLVAQGHDVKKAFEDWEAKQAAKGQVTASK